MEENQAGSVNADGDVAGLFRQAGLTCAVCAHDDDRLVRVAGDIERYIAEQESATVHRGQIYAKSLLRQTGVEAVRNGDGLDGALGPAGRLLSAKTDADVRRHLLDQGGEITPIDSLSAPEAIGAAQQVGQQVLAEASFVGRKPRRGRAAENRVAADPRREALHSRR